MRSYIEAKRCTTGWRSSIWRWIGVLGFCRRAGGERLCIDTTMRTLGLYRLVPVNAFALLAWSVVVVSGIADEHKDETVFANAHHPTISRAVAVTEGIDVIGVPNHVQRSRSLVYHFPLILRNDAKLRCEIEMISRGQERLSLFQTRTLVRSDSRQRKGRDTPYSIGYP